jgi:hypothetical protein
MLKLAVTDRHTEHSHRDWGTLTAAKAKCKNLRGVRGSFKSITAILLRALFVAHINSFLKS